MWKHWNSREHSRSNLIPGRTRMAYSTLRNIRSWRRDKREQQDNFSVIYLGSVQILCPIGEGICGSVEEIFENCETKLKSNLLPKQTLQIKDDCFELCRADDDDQGTKTVYSFSRIIYCGVDSKRRKILVFNYHHIEGEEQDVYLTHAFLCERKSVAKRLACTVAEYFERMKCVGAQEGDENGNCEESQLAETPGALTSNKDDRDIVVKAASESDIELEHINGSNTTPFNF